MDYDEPVRGVRESASADEQYNDESSRLGEMPTFADIPERERQQLSFETLHTTVRVEAFKRKVKTAKRNVWLSISRYKLRDRSAQDEIPAYYPYSLTVRLRFSGRLILEETSDRLITTRQGKSEQRPRISGSAPFMKASPLFNRPWIDETQDFNMHTVLLALRPPSFSAKGLGPKFTWYNDAVPIDAIFPPGVPLSAKEILAYYPHHVRWRDVSLRLARNEYRGGDILDIEVSKSFFSCFRKVIHKQKAFFRGAPSRHISTASMNTFQRDSFKKVIPGFKSDVFNLKHDRNLHTFHLSPGKYIVTMSGGFTVPTLDDLTRGLRHLPSGLDARCMTECLDWYLSWRNAFKPPLQLNVLHVQALSRALRIPLRPFGPQNLDVNALAEWKEKGRFEERPVARCAPIRPTISGSSKGPHTDTKRNRLDVNLSSERVTLDFQLPIRHVLTFPFLALHGVVGEALKLGIAKAGVRRMERGSMEPAEQGDGGEGKEDMEIM